MRDAHRNLKILGLPPKWAGVIAVFLIGVAIAAGFFLLRRQSPSVRPLVNALTVAGFDGRIGEPFGVAVKGRDVFVSDGENGVIWKIASDGIATQFAAGLDTPSGIAFAGDDLIVADPGTHSIKKITPNGKVVSLAGTDGSSGWLDGTANEAKFDAPVGVAVSDGRIYVADTYNDRIRLIENGRVSTLAGGARGFADGLGAAARFDTPTGIAFWNGRILVADTGNHRIRVVEADGSTWTIAGTGVSDRRDGLLGSASLIAPTAIAADATGSIYIADGNAIRVIRVRVIPIMTTVSGGRRGLSDGSPIKARFNRPSGLAFDANGELIVADSENRLVRRISPEITGKAITPEQISSLSEKPEAFRAAQPARWPYDPPTAKRDIAGTLAEIRGEVKPGNDDIHFHNGLDIAGSYGETARFVRDEKVLRPIAAENFGTLRELIRMPTMGYIHIRLGRDVNGVPFGDPRFQYTTDATGKFVDVRVPRGSHFKAGEPIGTLNPMNHVHLIAGRSGSEMNALDALVLPGISDTRPPTIEKVTLEDENWNPLETKSPNGRIQVSGKLRLIIRAYDQVDGNSDRRRLGVFQVGYQLLNKDLTPLSDPIWTIRFDRLPADDSIRLVYANGSKSGATGETIFNYIATDRVDGDSFNEDFLDTLSLNAGDYILRAFAADYFGNKSYVDMPIEVKR